MSRASHTTDIADQTGKLAQGCINFSSQDYLGLAQDQRILNAAKSAIDDFGVHSAGSPSLAGRTRYLLDLEERICSILGRESCTIFPTGWAAGFGVLAGLAREHDTIVLDSLSHNCLQEGARHSTKNVVKFRHNDINDLREKLAAARAENPRNGLFVVVESLYSMESDSPDLQGVANIAKEFEGILIVDIAHDFGAMGDRGLGLLETVNLDQGPDIIMGSFSKTFASNGGFIAASRFIRDYLQGFCPSLMFSNAISPIQTRIIHSCLDIVFSNEGAQLRSKCLNNVLKLRDCMSRHGLIVGGTSSPIVPVFVGEERVARLASRLIQERGLAANLVEFPAVPKGKARFRFQVMSTHVDESIVRASEIMSSSSRDAVAMWESADASI